MRRYWLDEETIHVQKRVAPRTACEVPTAGLVEITILPSLWTPCMTCFPPDLRSLRALERGGGT